MEAHRFSAHFKAARPRVIGALARIFNDLEPAEDLFQDACIKALEHWPRNGVPKDPAAWLITVGRRMGIDALRRDSRLEPLPADSAGAVPDLEEHLDHKVYRDDMLRLFFTCCHPILSQPHQVALALKVIGGWSVPEIARAFLVSPKTMEQRLTRAKKRIAGAGSDYQTPDARQRIERLKAVGTAIYLMFNEGYSASTGQDHIREHLCDEAIRLARLLLRLFPAEVEIMGLLALCLLQHSRSPARLDAGGQIVLLDEQNRALWNQNMILEGSLLVEKASRHGKPGPFQIQAAIAAVHANSLHPEGTDWEEISRLYAILERLQSSPVIRLNRAVAVSKAQGSHQALKLMDTIALPMDGYFHFHGVRGRLLADCDRSPEALVELERALSLARTPAERSHIQQEMKKIEKNEEGLSG